MTYRDKVCLEKFQQCFFYFLIFWSLIFVIAAQKLRHVPLINESLKSWISSGVEGTPTFFVNGVRHEDSWDLETFSETLKKHLTRQV